jgi:ubiquinone/menaquinone biosynthesis C-methylase UbiE
MTRGTDYSSETFAEFYDHLDVYTNRGDVEFFASEAVTAGGPVLELGCGTGRVLVPCARAGAAMWGLDVSETMLARCGWKLLAEPDDVRRRVVRNKETCETFALTLHFN